jgi:hypothetical protein
MEFKEYHISPNQLTISFVDGSTITDLALFFSRHESYIANMREGKARTAYLNRYNKVKEQLTQKENGTSRNL